MNVPESPAKVVFASEGRTGLTCEIIWEEAGQHLKEAGAYFSIRHESSAGHYAKDYTIDYAITELEDLATDCVHMVAALRALKEKP